MKRKNNITSLSKVGDLEFEYLLEGHHGPTLVFFNGFRIPLDSWDRIIPALKPSARLFFYNRLNVGASSRANQPQNGEVVIADLRRLLSIVGLDPPYILIAHSFGGILANLFARSFPRETAGLILVESAHPDEAWRHRKHPAPFIVRMINDSLKKMEKAFNPYAYSEDECLPATLTQIALHDKFPAIPVAVISGTKKMPFVPGASFQLHLRYQQELLQLSPLSTQYLCARSGHFPQISEPECVVTAMLDFLAGHFR